MGNNDTDASKMEYIQRSYQFLLAGILSIGTIPKLMKKILGRYYSGELVPFTPSDIARGVGIIKCISNIKSLRKKYKRQLI